MKLHEPGECPEPYYGESCDGIGHWRANPYAEEINGDHTPLWICDGVAYGAAMDI